MGISILTQKNHFLVNQSVFSLVERLKATGLDIVVYRCSATSSGRRVNKIESIFQVIKIFGVLFLVRVAIKSIVSFMLYPDYRLKKLCKVIDVSDDQPFNQTTFKDNKENLDALLIVSGTKIIKAEILDLFCRKVINIHSSLLPYSKGLMPAYWTFYKKRGLGVTLFELDEGIDTGTIIYQVPIKDPGGTYFDYLFQTKRVGIDLLMAWVLQNLTKCSKVIDIESTYNPHPKSKFK